jgi:hypothetical protein
VICVVSWITLVLLVVSSPFPKVFLIGCYSEGIFRVMLALGTHERRRGSLVHEHVLASSSEHMWQESSALENHFRISNVGSYCESFGELMKNKRRSNAWRWNDHE